MIVRIADRKVGAHQMGIHMCTELHPGTKARHASRWALC